MLYTESGLKLPGLDLASLATQGVGAGAQPNAYTGYGIEHVYLRPACLPLRFCGKIATLLMYAKGSMVSHCGSLFSDGLC